MSDFEVSATSNSPTAVKITKPQESVKVASTDLLLVTNNSLPVDTIADLIFDDIGGQEIINLSRTDLISGVNNSYQIVSDSLQLKNGYNSKNLIPMPGQSDFFFKSQGIDLYGHLPTSYIDLNDDFVIKETTVVVSGVSVIQKRYVEIVTVVGNGTSATYTTSSPHGLRVGDTISVVGVAPSGYNVTNVAIASSDNYSFSVANSETGEHSSSINSIYLDKDTGDLVIEVDNMQENEFVEIEITSSTNVFNDTMY